MAWLVQRMRGGSNPPLVAGSSSGAAVIAPTDTSGYAQLIQQMLQQSAQLSAAYAPDHGPLAAGKAPLPSSLAAATPSRRWWPAGDSSGSSGTASSSGSANRTGKQLADNLPPLLHILEKESSDSEVPGATGPAMQMVLEQQLLEQLARACLPDQPAGLRLAWLDFLADLLLRVQTPLLILQPAVAALQLTLLACGPAAASLPGSATAAAASSSSSGPTAAATTASPPGRGRAAGSASSQATPARGRPAAASSPPVLAGGAPSALATAPATPAAAVPTDAAQLAAAVALVKLASRVCKVVSEDPGLLAILVTSDPQPHCALAAVLLPYFHAADRLGAQAREALLILCGLANQHRSLADYLLHYSGLAVEVGLRLGAVYGTVPTVLPVSRSAWRISEAKLRNGLPSLNTFLELVAFADNLVQAAPPALATVVVTGVECALLQPVMLPALHQRRAADAGAAVVYLHLALKHVSQPLLLRAFLRLILASELDGAATFAVLVRRMDALGDLGYLTLAFFQYLLSLHSEDVMLSVCLRCLARRRTRQQSSKDSDGSSRSQGSLPPTPGSVPGAQQLHALERRQWQDWGMGLQSGCWLLRLRPGLVPESPSNRHFGDYVVDARHALALAQSACKPWSKLYWLTDAETATVRDQRALHVDEEQSRPPALSLLDDSPLQPLTSPVASDGTSVTLCQPGSEDFDSLFLSKLSIMIERLPQSSVQTSLMVTALVRRLASYPQPLIRAFVFGGPGTRLEALTVGHWKAGLALTAQAGEEAPAAASSAASSPTVTATPAAAAAAAYTLPPPPDNLLQVLLKVEVALQQMQEMTPHLATELAAYRRDAEGCFKSADGSKGSAGSSSTSGKKARRPTRGSNAALGEAVSAAGAMSGEHLGTLLSPSVGSPLVRFHRQAGAPGSSGKPANQEQEVEFARGGDGVVPFELGEETPSIADQSERSDRSAPSTAASSIAHPLATGAASADVLQSEAAGRPRSLTKEALARHEQVQIASGSSDSGFHGSSIFRGHSGDEGSGVEGDRDPDLTSQLDGGVGASPLPADEGLAVNGAADAAGRCPTIAAQLSQKEQRVVVRKVLIFEEFLKELAALALEQSLLSVKQASSWGGGEERMS